MTPPRSKSHLRVVGGLEPAEEPRDTDQIDQLHAYCVRLLVGYVRGGFNNHDILIRGVGVAEACALLRGALPDGLQVSSFIDKTLTRLTRIPDYVLVEIMEQTSHSQQLLLIEPWVRG